MRYLEQRTGRCFDIDIFGNGPHEDEIKAAASKQNIPGFYGVGTALNYFKKTPPGGIFNISLKTTFNTSFQRIAWRDKCFPILEKNRIRTARF